jgi:sulfite exporter TauE/SafE
MPVDLLTLSAAWLSGLLGGLHCVAMCGGIATSLSVAATPASSLRPSLGAASWLNAGRVLGYVLAGAVVGGLGGGMLGVLRIEGLGGAVRVLLGLALVLVALRLFGVGSGPGFLARPGAALWRQLAPLQRRLLPAHTPTRRLALGMLWGWLPCGLSSSLLVVAWLEADALHGALVMASFGLGTLPTMLPLTWSGARMAGWLGAGKGRRVAAGTILVAGLLTMAAPWLAAIPAVHTLLLALGCRSLT